MSFLCSMSVDVDIYKIRCMWRLNLVPVCMSGVGY